MKKILILSMSLLSLFSTSCEDMLEVSAPDQLTTGNYWRNASDVDKALAAAYSQLEASTSTWSFYEAKWTTEAFREDLYNLGSDAYNYNNWVAMYDFTYSNNIGEQAYIWDKNYFGISYANQIIAKIADVPDSEITDEQRRQYTAEARFLRGYYHMKLLLNWEKIILRDKFITDPAELDKGLSERVATWEFIIEDLKASTEGLPVVYPSANTGRATYGAANAYLGWAYLTRAWEENNQQFFTDAITAFDEVAGYNLVEMDRYLDMFNGTYKNSPESIFELQFSPITANGASYRTAIHKFMAVSELSGWDEIVPSQMLMDEFFKEGEIATTGLYDSRLYETIFYQCDYFNDPTALRVYGNIYDFYFTKTNDQGIEESYNRPAFRKFLPKTWEILKDASRVDINIPLMRYSNVLLMKAEALNQLNKTGDAISLINQVRARADMPEMDGTTKDDVQAQIEHERILEFALENFRFYDMRRWGVTEQRLHAVDRTNFDPQKHNFFPIPLAEEQSNGAL